MTDSSKITRTLGSGGIKGRKQEIDLLSLALPDYVYRQSHPALKHFQKYLYGYIVHQYYEYMDPEVSCFK